MEKFFKESFILRYWDDICIIIISLILIFILRRDHKKNQQQQTSKYIVINSKDSQAFSDITLEENTKYYEHDILLPALEDKPHVPYAGANIKLDGGAEQFYQMMCNRRSVRHFNSHHKAPHFEIIEKCIHAAGTSPSGAHTEPWTFCVISEMSMKRRIRDIVEAEEALNYAQRMHRQWTTDLIPLKTDCNKSYLTDAPFLVVIFKQIYGQLPDGRRRQHYYNEISTSIAVGILLCAFQAAGLSTLVTTPLNCGSALRKLLSRPENEKLLVLLPVGYAAEDCLVPDLERKPLNDILVRFYNK